MAGLSDLQGEISEASRTINDTIIGDMLGGIAETLGFPVFFIFIIGIVIATIVFMSFGRPSRGGGPTIFTLVLTVTLVSFVALNVGMFSFSDSSEEEEPVPEYVEPETPTYLGSQNLTVYRSATIDDSKDESIFSTDILDSNLLDDGDLLS